MTALTRAGTPDPHTVMAFSGHSTPSMLRRYHIIDLDVMRHAAERASARRSEPGTLTPLRDRPTSAYLARTLDRG